MWRPTGIRNLEKNVTISHKNIGVPCQYLIASIIVIFELRLHPHNVSAQDEKKESLQWLSRVYVPSSFATALHSQLCYSAEFLLLSDICCKSLLADSLLLVELSDDAIVFDCSLIFPVEELLESSSMIDWKVSWREYKINPTALIPKTEVAR